MVPEMTYSVSVSSGTLNPTNSVLVMCRMCTDVDECVIIPGSCGNGTCQNEPGRYRCVCHRGFEDPMNMQMCMGESSLLTSSCIVTTTLTQLRCEP